MKKLVLTILAVLLMASLAFGYTGLNYGQPASYDYNPIATVTKTTTYTITSADDYIKCDATSASFTVTLPSIASLRASGFGAKSYKIEKTDATAYTVTVAVASGNTIGGETTRVIVNQNGQIVIHSQGTDWVVDYETPYLVEDHEAGTTAFGGTQPYDAAVGITFDDGVTDSPALTLKDATDETLAIVKVDSSFATFTTEAADGVQITTGNLKVGNGTPTNAQDGEDFYAEGIFELDMGASGTGVIGDSVLDSLTIGASLQGATPLYLDGTTDNTFDVAIGVLTDPTADVTVKIPSLTNGTLMLSTLTTNDVDVANSVWGISNGLAMGGATGANTFELQLKPMGDPAADKYILFPVLTDSAAMISSLVTNDVNVANSIWGVSNGLAFGGATGANGFETTLSPTDPGADATITIPNNTGTMSVISTASHDYGAAAVAWTMTATETAASHFVVTNANGAIDAVMASCIAGKLYTITNGSGQTVTLKVTGQTGGSVANAKSGLYMCNGTDVLEVFEQS